MGTKAHRHQLGFIGQGETMLAELLHVNISISSHFLEKVQGVPSRFGISVKKPMFDI